MCTIKIMQKKIDLWRIKKKAVPVVKRINSFKKKLKKIILGAIIGANRKNFLPPRHAQVRRIDIQCD
jgi:hypothetical protein